MRALVVLAAAIVVATAGAAPSPAPTKEVAIAELRASIREERSAIALLGAKPPKLQGASIQLDRGAERLPAVADYASSVRLTPSVEQSLRQTSYIDRLLANQLRDDKEDDPGAYQRSIKDLIAKKLAALEEIQKAAVPTGTPQCSDGKDNDRDGIVDWTLEPGCSSARDLREQSPFSCDIEQRIASGRLAVTGSCSGAFSEIELTLLDSRLNGRFDIKHAPSCRPPTLEVIRCSTKDAAQNPGRLFDVRLATTSNSRAQRVQLRFFDKRKRQLRRYVSPVLR